MNALELTEASTGRDTTWCSDCRSVPVPMDYINNPECLCSGCNPEAVDR